jgi:hypothetical protein
MKDPEDRTKELFGKCYELIELAGQMLQTCKLKSEKVSSHSRGVVAFFFRRAWEMFESFLILVQEKRLVDAALLLRSLCDMTINLEYITVDQKEKKKRAMKYVLEGNRAQLKIINTNLKGFKEISPTIEVRRDELKEDLAKIEEELKNEYGDEDWDLPPIEQRACKSGEIVYNYYNLVYRPYSNIEHHNIFFGQDYVDREKCEPLEDPKEIVESNLFQPHITLYMFKGLFLVILSKFNEEYQLKWGEKIKTLLEEHKEEFNLYKAK